MSTIEAKGIVIRQTDYGEANRMLTIFTKEYGIIKAAARGVRKVKSRQAAASQFLCYSDLNLYKGTSDIVTLNSAQTIESFYPICEDIEKLALFTYLSDVTAYLVGEGNPDEEILRLFLNTLYLCAYEKLPPLMAKVVYELRVMAYSGYAPDLSACASCKDSDIRWFDTRSAHAFCDRCVHRKNGMYALSKDMAQALLYILSAPEKKMFSFRATDALLERLSTVSESYVRDQAEKDFPSLAYLKKLLT